MLCVGWTDEEYETVPCLARMLVSSFFVQTKTKLPFQETEHLMSKADKDGDELLSVEEILDKSDLFVGSEATNHGENLVELSHDEL